MKLSVWATDIIICFTVKTNIFKYERNDKDESVDKWIEEMSVQEGLHALDTAKSNRDHKRFPRF